jgi:hypothetical protein
LKFLLCGGLAAAWLLAAGATAAAESPQWPTGPGFYQPSAEERRLQASPFFKTRIDEFTREVTQFVFIRRSDPQSGSRLVFVQNFTLSSRPELHLEYRFSFERSARLGFFTNTAVLLSSNGVTREWKLAWANIDSVSVFAAVEPEFFAALAATTNAVMRFSGAAHAPDFKFSPQEAARARLFYEVFVKPKEWPKIEGGFE